MHSLTKQFKLTRRITQYKSQIGDCPLCSARKVLHVTKAGPSTWVFCTNCRKGDFLKDFLKNEGPVSKAARLQALFESIKGRLLPGEYCAEIGLLPIKDPRYLDAYLPMDFQTSLRGEYLTELLQEAGLPPARKRHQDSSYIVMPIWAAVGKSVGLWFFDTETGRNYTKGMCSAMKKNKMLWVQLKDGPANQTGTSSLVDLLPLRNQLVGESSPLGLCIPILGELWS